MLKAFSDLNIIEEDDEDSYLIDSLLQAADEGNIEEVKDLLDDNNPSLHANSHNKHQETALHFCSSSDHLDVVKYLVEKGADVESTDKHSETPLYWAARQGNVDVVEWLVCKGAVVDASNELGQTALMAAVKYGKMEMVEVLCRLQADVNYADVQGETVAHSLAWMDVQADLCDVIYSIASLHKDAKNKNQETALHISAGRGNTACLESLLHHGADVNCVDKRASTPLHLACHCQHIPVVKQLLLVNNINLNAVDQNGDTPLHIVNQSGLLKVVKLLCYRGCHVDAVNKVGRTPLHTSARLGHTEIVRFLLVSGASINFPYKNSITAQMMAVARGKNDTAELLSKLNADKQSIAIRQLIGGGKRVGRVKMKVFGSSGVGKSRLIQALKTGFFGKLFKRRSNVATQPSTTNPFHTPPASSSSSISSIPSILIQESQTENDRRQWDQSKTPTRPSPSHPFYTRGIHVQSCNISGGVGELSVWEFSGYEAYFQFYDMFIGDVNCIHMVCFDPLSTTHAPSQTPPSTPHSNSQGSTPLHPTSLPTHLPNPIHVFKMVNYWLNFLKSRIPASEPIGKDGQLQARAKVVLVGIVQGFSKSQMPEFEDGGGMYNQLHELCLCMKIAYKMDLEVHPKVFIVDPIYPSSLKPLKSFLSDLKQLVCQNLPTSSGFLDATLVALPAWREVLSGYPVVTWTNFIEYVRSSVNILCGEDHLKELIYKLQIMGEVTFVETRESEDDLVVLDVNWLCHAVLGGLLSHDLTSICRRSGCYGIDDFQFMFPDFEAAEVLHLLQALSLCTCCDIREKEEGGLYECGKLKKKSLSVLELNSLPSADHKDFTSEYEIPCLNFVIADRAFWDRNPSDTTVNTVYAGSRYLLFCPYCYSNVEKSMKLRQSIPLLDDQVCFNSTPSLDRSPIGEISRNGSVPGDDASSKRVLNSPSLSKKPSKKKVKGVMSTPLLPSYLSSHLTNHSKDPTEDTTGSDWRPAYNQLSQVFTRIQHELRRKQVEEGGSVELCFHAVKYSKDEMEVLVTYEEVEYSVNRRVDDPQHNPSKRSTLNNVPLSSLCHCCLGYIEVKCRGPSDMPSELFYLLKHTSYQVETTISMCCPSLDVCHQVLSSSQVLEHRENILSFSQKEILEAYNHSGIDAIVCYKGDNGDECVESLLDLIAFGSSEVFESLSFATDLPLNYINLQTRRKLASLLDPSEQTGCDWCMLAILLGLSNQVPDFEFIPPGEQSFSKTNRIFQLLNHLSIRQDDIDGQNNKENNNNNDKDNTENTPEDKTTASKLEVNIGMLIKKLQNLGRHDAVEVIYTMCPLTFRPVPDNNDDNVSYNADANGDYDRDDYNVAYDDAKNYDKNGFESNVNNVNNVADDDGVFDDNYPGDGDHFGEVNGEIHKDDGSDEMHNEEDMYIDDNYGDCGGNGVFEAGDLKLHDRMQGGGYV